MLVKSDLTSKDTSLWSSGICTVLIASMKLSVDCSLCGDLSVMSLRMLTVWKVGEEDTHRIQLRLELFSFDNNNY